MEKNIVVEVIIFQSDAYRKLQEELIGLFKQALKDAIKEQEPASDWVTYKEAQELLPYRSKTKWQQLRDRGEIVFSQFGRKILYSRQSLIDYVKNNKIS